MSSRLYIELALYTTHVSGAHVCIYMQNGFFLYSERLSCHCQVSCYSLFLKFSTQCLFPWRKCQIHAFIQNIFFVVRHSFLHRCSRLKASQPFRPLQQQKQRQRDKQQSSASACPRWLFAGLLLPVVSCYRRTKCRRCLQLHSAARLPRQAGRQASSQKPAGKIQQPRFEMQAAAINGSITPGPPDMGSSLNTTPLSYTTFVLSRFQLLVSVCGATP